MNVHQNSSLFTGSEKMVRGKGIDEDGVIWAEKGKE